MAVSTSSLLVQTPLEADSFSSMNGIIMRHKVKFSIFALEKFSIEEDIEKRAVVALTVGLPVTASGTSSQKNRLLMNDGVKDLLLNEKD